MEQLILETIENPWLAFFKLNKSNCFESVANTGNKQAATTRREKRCVNKSREMFNIIPV